MQTSQTYHSTPDSSPFGVVLSSVFAAFLALVAFHLSLVATSAPLSLEERDAVNRAIDLLDERGFETEVFLLRRTTTFRGSDHWLNLLAEKERAFAASNVPFQLVTLYSDFYTKAADDTERAMILLHEAQHLMARDEAAAYSYVWQNRERLGWTQLSHGTTVTYITIQQQTREHAPELFTCPANMWNDCTEELKTKNGESEKLKTKN